jgi:hypothetical protein
MGASGSSSPTAGGVTMYHQCVWSSRGTRKMIEPSREPGICVPVGIVNGVARQ